jgi:hypothetical protein
MSRSPDGQPVVSRRPVATGILLAAAALICGCEALAPRGAAARADQADADIVEVYSYLEGDPWVRDGDGRIVALKMRAYFVSSATGKGRFVPGLVRGQVFLTLPRKAGGYERFRLYEWELNELETQGFRLKKPSVLGDSYGLVLRWPDKLNIMGHNIEVTISYQRGDGREIKAPTRQLSVPLPPRYTALDPLKLLEIADQYAAQDRPTRKGAE